MSEVSYEFRLGRIIVKAGDLITVKSSPGHRDGFVGKVREASVDDHGQVLAITVIGGKAGRPDAWRTIAPERCVGITEARMAKMRQIRAERLDVRPAIVPKKRKRAYR